MFLCCMYRFIYIVFTLNILVIYIVQLNAYFQCIYVVSTSVSTLYLH
jgi:hypothetical protein